MTNDIEIYLEPIYFWECFLSLAFSQSFTDMNILYYCPAYLQLDLNSLDSSATQWGLDLKKIQSQIEILLHVINQMTKENSIF